MEYRLLHRCFICTKILDHMIHAKAYVVNILKYDKATDKT